MRKRFRRAISPSHFLMMGAAICGLALAGCDDNGGDPKKQIGANPVLPDPQQYLLPPMHIARVAHWGEGEKPMVPQGLQIRALATGLQHPRSLYALPNGDVLVVPAIALRCCAAPTEMLSRRSMSFSTI
jgi:glucose/arabinose dehydrogenase